MRFNQSLVFSRHEKLINILVNMKCVPYMPFSVDKSFHKRLCLGGVIASNEYQRFNQKH